MKHIRIELKGNESRLVYSNGYILVYSSIISKIHNYYGYQSALKNAYSQLRNLINFEKDELRSKDTLASKEVNHTLMLLRHKRKQKARECFNSKSPINKTKHVGVEIEFISNSERSEIALDLAMLNLTTYTHLKNDGSVHDEGGDVECDGSCRDNCECAFCGETHYCDCEDECNRRNRNENGRNAAPTWTYNDDCNICTDTETIDDCDCGGKDSEGNDICNGGHIVCCGHCEGHSCQGYDDHNDYDCNCECTCDGSNNGHEIAIVAKSSQIAEIINKVCFVLKKHNAEVNKTCGLHVHIDARDQDEKKIFSNLVKSQRLLYSMVPRSRYNNDYYKPNKSKNMASYTSRYWGINPQAYGDHKTIEIRLHSGTINPDKINNWIQLLQKIAYCKKGLKEIEKLSDLTKVVKLSHELLEYISKRLATFKNDHGEYSLLDDVTQEFIVKIDSKEDSELIAA